MRTTLASSTSLFVLFCWNTWALFSFLRDVEVHELDGFELDMAGAPRDVGVRVRMWFPLHGGHQ